MPWRYLATLLAANLILLLPPGSPFRTAGAVLLIGLLPGLSWTTHVLAHLPPLLRWTTAAALSFSITILATLLLSYLPGPVEAWQILVGLNLLALLPIFLTKSRGAEEQGSRRDQYFSPASLPLRVSTSFLLILLIALLLRTLNLDYSEFQGDEALAMIAAAESLEGHEDALFLRAKGPGEVLLPMALWRLTGIINEPIARLPFTAASLLAIITIYLIGQKIGGERVGWLAAGFFAFNGFMVAFGRIVQYQALVLWFSALAFLLILEWRETRQPHLALLAGLCLGVGLLGHYDAVLVIPAIGWLLVSDLIPGLATADRRVRSLPLGPLTTARNWFAFIRSGGRWSAVSGLIVVFLLAALPFYLPFTFDPQANRTGDYVGARIGSELRNNLPEFFHFNTFYSSSYYLMVTGLLALGVLTWLLWQTSWGRWLGVATIIGVLAVMLNPTLLTVDKLNLSILPFALLLGSAFFILLFNPSNSLLRVPTPYSLLPTPYSLPPLILWLAVPFLGYNFVWQDYPAGNLPFYWTPYGEPPNAGFFGFAHRAAWKATGQKIASGELAGDYGSNEEPDVTTWYTRGAPRACDPQPEFYFLADDLIDPVKVPDDLITSTYEQIGRVTLPNQKQMRIMQLKPNTLTLDDLAEPALANDFDRTASPASFARSVRGSIPTEANFSHLIRLIGYDLDTRRAYPGGRIPVTLYWQALTPISTSYQVFTHLEGKSGPVAQADGVPVCWSYPTDAWRPGQIIADQHTIQLSPDVPAGDYPLLVGLYRADTFARLDVLNEAGAPIDNSVTLTPVKITTAND
ncbi:MAG: glycosyltransferase family 39 protein [Chloroflexi bacterium]|nr:glycosyltransferase family 39 protein [Chloroflexota bacterium]